MVHMSDDDEGGGCLGAKPSSKAGGWEAAKAPKGTVGILDQFQILLEQTCSCKENRKGV